MSLSQPQLICSFGNFNIVLFSGKYFALSQTLGAVDLAGISDSDLVKMQTQKFCFIESTIDAIKAKLSTHFQSFVPTLVGTVGSFNIVAFGGLYFALAQSLGEIDLARLTESELIRIQQEGKCFAGSSLDEVKLKSLNHGRLSNCRSVYDTLPPLPDITIQSGLDFLLLELPPRYMPFMPNGLAYVDNILRGCGITFQTIDVSIIFYHRYHSFKTLNKVDKVYAPSGVLMPDDPWDNTTEAEWAKDEVVDYFWPQLNKIVEDIVDKKPKMIGVSLNGFNRKLVTRFMVAIRKRLPDTVLFVGGYDCCYPNVGPRMFQDYDYMIIGEAEVSLKKVINLIMKGEIPKDMPGVLSRFDSKDRVYESAPLHEDLNSLSWPTYDWIRPEFYQSYNGNHLVPITASRGCKWSRCRFCAECFSFRMRSPKSVVDEIESWTNKGFQVFHFNESDVNGDPQNLYRICGLIIERKLKIKMIGQLRIDKRNTKEYLQHLANAGFVHLRFGVDGWSQNSLKFQRKGYTMDTVFQNLRDCHSVGIRTTVNMVVGVPGETENDVLEIIDNIKKLKGHIDLVEGINPLILAAGSEYWIHPEKYNICFRGDKDRLYQKHPQAIPPSLWYSQDPYIDQPLRMQWVEKICTELHASNINIGSYAAVAIANMKKRNQQESGGSLTVEKNGKNKF